MTHRLLGVLLAACSLASAARSEEAVRRLSVREYRDKMKAGWVGQMAGVSFGGPTEFKVKGRIMPEDRLPTWHDGMVNDSFGQDDLYVEMTFLRSLETRGLDVSSRQAGLDFAASKYQLWHANHAGRDNLRKGIAPPDSGHPQFNKCCDDIDYQIESDVSGLVAPGMPGVVILLGEKFGRLMNYGDGVYAGQFVGALYAEAFFGKDMRKIVETALRAIPAESRYAEMVRDMLRWHREHPESWEKVWELCEEKYHRNPEYSKGLCSGPGGPDHSSIDAKLNGAYVIMGLLYGERDPLKSMSISCRCGQDSDCNPSNTAGVVFTSIGFAQLPPTFGANLNEKAFFSHTAYSFPALLDACEKVARQALAHAGGRIDRDANGEETFVIPCVEPVPSALEKSWAPAPITHARYAEAELQGLGSEGHGDPKTATESK
jgi:hypothetical protein